MGATTMRYAIFGALIVSLELFAGSIASAAMPASGNAIVTSRDLIQVWYGCGGKRVLNKKTKKCEDP
jgi:hypothetical protein